MFRKVLTLAEERSEVNVFIGARLVSVDLTARSKWGVDGRLIGRFKATAQFSSSMS